MASSPNTSWQIEGGKVEALTEFLFLGSKITVDSDCSHAIKRLAPWKESYDEPRWCIKKQRHHFANKGLHNQSHTFSSSHVWIWEVDHEKGWAPKNWCFQIVVLERTFESPVDCKEINPINPKGKQPLIFIGRTDVKAAAPILWPPDEKSWLTGKDPDAGKYWRQKEKGATDDEMVR